MQSGTAKILLYKTGDYSCDNLEGRIFSSPFTLQPCYVVCDFLVLFFKEHHLPNKLKDTYWITVGFALCFAFQ